MEDSGNIRQEFKCRICSKSLSSKQNLKQHMNIHTGRRPFRCTYPGCDTAYKHASQLSNHKILHRPQKIKVSYPFDDLKTFIGLVLKALGPDSEKTVRIPDGPYKPQDISLPPILNSQIGLKLPNFQSL